MEKSTNNKKIVYTNRIKNLQSALLKTETKEQVLEIAKKIRKGEF